MGSYAQSRITASISVSQNPELVADAGADMSDTTGNTVTIGATPSATGGDGAYAYSWSPGATLDDSTIANPTHTVGSSNVTFTLDVTDGLNCSASDDVTVNVQIVSINEIEKASFLVYPNPASSELHIQGLESLKGLNASLSDINGKTFRAIVLEDGMNKMDVSDLSPGVYLLKVSSDADEYQSKIVIE